MNGAHHIPSLFEMPIDPTTLPARILALDAGTAAELSAWGLAVFGNRGVALRSPLSPDAISFREAMRVAMLGVASSEAARRLGQQLFPETPAFEEAGCRVLEAKRPLWLTSVVHEALEGAQSVDAWTFLRRLERAGLIPRQQGVAYLRGMVSQLGGGGSTSGSHRERALAEVVRDDPAVLETLIWPVLSEGLCALPPLWIDLLIEAAAEGRVDRGRLLDATLEGLAAIGPSDESFLVLHRRLAPDSAERSARATAYARLALAENRGARTLGAGVPAPALPSSWAVDVEDLEAQAGALSPSALRLAGVPEALAAARRGALLLDPPPSSPETYRSIPRLIGRGRLRPITRLDELIDRLLALFEEAGNADDIELGLDAVSRLVESDRQSFRKETAPLRDRALNHLGRDVSGSADFTAAAPDPRDLLAFLVVAWIEKRPPDGITVAWTGLQRHEAAQPLPRFFARRVFAAATRAARREPTQLLATPTHRGGWIDPHVLLDRIEARGATRVELHDTVQALLRLAPDHREEALGRARRLRSDLGEIAAVVRHALGGDEDPVGSTAALWVAAARSRGPREDDAAVSAPRPGRRRRGALPSRRSPARSGGAVARRQRMVDGGLRDRQGPLRGPAHARARGRNRSHAVRALAHVALHRGKKPPSNPVGGDVVARRTVRPLRERAAQTGGIS